MVAVPRMPPTEFMLPDEITCALFLAILGVEDDVEIRDRLRGGLSDLGYDLPGEVDASGQMAAGVAIPAAGEGDAADRRPSLPTPDRARIAEITAQFDSLEALLAHIEEKRVGW